MLAYQSVSGSLCGKSVSNWEGSFDKNANEKDIMSEKKTISIALLPYVHSIFDIIGIDGMTSQIKRE